MVQIKKISSFVKRNENGKYSNEFKAEVKHGEC